MSSVVFYYDIVCPFAYMASRMVEGIGQRAGVAITWRPVLLAGLYEFTKAPQGKEGSAMDNVAAAKLRIINDDLHRQMHRRNVPYRQPVFHPQRTVNAMKLLCGIHDNHLRQSISHDLYKAYWCEARDVSDIGLLEEVAAHHGVNASELVNSDSASKKLRANTREAADRGAFGVPSFYVKDHLYFGSDHLFFVEQKLGIAPLCMERLMEPPKSGSALLSFFFDYSSPWSYLACMRLNSVLQRVHPVQVKVDWVPILLGALFKEIGTPMVPASVLTETKRKYFQQDLDDWCDYAGVSLRWPDAFPLRTVLPLRVTLASDCDPTVIRSIFVAAWQKNKDIGQPEVLREVLVGAGVDADQLMRMAETEPLKKQLFLNTTRAVDDGLCGVPTFRVNNGPIVWGQDRYNVVEDMLCGWQDQRAKL